jgi:hypothetical protein
MIEYLPDFESQINRLSEDIAVKIMDNMKVRMNLESDFKNHSYFFDSPDYTS